MEFLADRNLIQSIFCNPHIPLKLKFIVDKLLITEHHRFPEVSRRATFWQTFHPVSHIVLFNKFPKFLVQTLRVRNHTNAKQNHKKNCPFHYIHYHKC